MKPIYLTLLIAITMLSCKKDITVDEGDIAFIGGEIINPNDNKVILLKSDKVLDTILLDKNNRFLYKIKNLESGLYKFYLQAYHSVEFQLALLEPNDSIIFRLNTIDFDESLVYTGQGAKKNNFLMNMYLKNEAENEKVLRFSQLPPKEFEKRLDSFRSIRNTELTAFISKNNPSDLFKEIADANINYNYYLSKEIYPFAYYGDNEVKNLNALPKDFYNYRNKIDYNNNLLKDYFTYYTFLRYHFRNLALSEHLKQSNDSTFNRKSLSYNLLKLNLIDSLVDNKTIKEPLLGMSAINFINNTDNLEDIDLFIKSYDSKSSDEYEKKHIFKLVDALNKLKPGNKIPDIGLKSFKDQQINLQSIIKRPSVIYFWTHDYRSHFKESHEKAKELKEKYPEIDFISINLDSKALKANAMLLKQYNFSTHNEFQFINPKEGKNTLAISPLTKVMILDKDGTIVKNHTNLFSIFFEQELLALLNK